MPFPTTPRVVFEKNPLTQVIAQLQFPPILRIATEEPAAFQDRVRARFPLYERNDPVEVPPPLREVLQRLNLGGQAHAQRAAFRNPDLPRSLFLAQNFIALEDTEYERWEQFRSDLEMGLDSLREVYQPAFFTRVGLRYVDVIDRNILGLTEHRWSDLIRSTLVGLVDDEDVGSDVSEAQSIAIVELGLDVPAQMKLQHGLRRASNGSSSDASYVIDADFFTEPRVSLDGALNILDEFNGIAGNFFRWAITNRLHNALDPRPVNSRRRAAS